MKSVQLVQKVVQVWNWKQLRKQLWQNWKEYTRVFRDSDSRGHKWCFTVLSGHLYRFLPPWNHKMPANVSHHREENQPRTLKPKKAASKPPPLTSNTATTGCSRHDRPLYYHFRLLTLALPPFSSSDDEDLIWPSESSSKSYSGPLLSSGSVWFLLISNILVKCDVRASFAPNFQTWRSTAKEIVFLILKFSQEMQNWIERIAFA